MPRCARKPSSTGIYHVMVRGVNRQRIFEDADDYERFLSILSEIKPVSGFRLYAYCLMSNHVHLLIKEGSEPLAMVFRRIGVRYVAWFNKKYDRCGHLFQDRFKSVPIETDSYFITALIYLYQNPVKAGLIGTPQEYRWSSRRFLGSGKMIDEADLFHIIPLDMILEKERSGSSEELLEQQVGRPLSFSDSDLQALIRDLSGAENVEAFRRLDLRSQSTTLVELRKRGVSLRQIAHASGLTKPVIEHLCQCVAQAR